MAVAPRSYILADAPPNSPWDPTPIYIEGLTPAASDPVHNGAALKGARMAFAESRYRPFTITVVGDSITWGVGSDGNPEQITPLDATQQAAYRQFAWPVQVAANLNASLNLTSTEGWVGASNGWSYSTVTGTAGLSDSLGPFGGFAAGGGGGRSIAGTANSVNYPKDRTRAFTEVDVWYFGTGLGANNPTDPTVEIDGVVSHTSTATVAAGGLMKVTVTGLTDVPHDITVKGAAGGRTVFHPGVTLRRGNGVVVNRIGRPGATALHATGSAQTGNARSRVIQSAVMPGTTDLLVVALGTNDESQQVPVADFQTRVQELVNNAGSASVLLLGGPPSRFNGAIPASAYRDVMKGISGAAFLDVQDVFGPRAEAESLGLFASPTTVHPSRRGAAVIAKAVTDLLA